MIYGAAEFSKDVDFLVVAARENFQKIQAAAEDLKTEVIAIPPFEARFLDEGLAIHLRCTTPEASGMRVDLMSIMRNVSPFPEIWERRSTLELEGCDVHILSVPDLVQSKKTQRSKDWPMIQRLVEVHFEENKAAPKTDDIRFWLEQSLTEKILIETASRYSDLAQSLAEKRPLLEAALSGDTHTLRKRLTEEIEAEKERDRIYWEPLKKRLAHLRKTARNS